LAVLLVAWVGSPHTASAVVVPPDGVGSYHFDGQLHDAPSLRAAVERGPLTAYDDHATTDTAVRWSPGDAARLGTVPATVFTAYATSATFVRVARAMPTTERQAQVARADPTSLS
jgi:hypothetical protein